MNTQVATFRQLVTGAEEILAAAGVPSPGPDARALAAHALGVDRLDPLLREVPTDFAATFAQLVERRRQREPLQHITGRAPFRYLDLAAESGVFIPRPETETVAQYAIDAARPLGACRVVDLCCGSGPIALSLAQEVPAAQVWAIDASEQAVSLTVRNGEAVGLRQPRLQVSVGDVTDPQVLSELNSSVDVVVSNPPYIPPDAIPREVEVREFDPDLALYGGGSDGLALPAAVVDLARRLLRPGGVFVMEHAEVQAAQVRELVRNAGFDSVDTFADLTGRDRGVRAIAPEPPAPTVAGSTP